MFKKLKNISILAGIILWVSSMVLWNYHIQYSSKIYSKQFGAIYPLHNHGIIVYLTQNEHIFLYSLIFGGFGLMMASAFFYFQDKNNRS